METERANPAATVKKRPFPRSVGCPRIMTGRCSGPAAAPRPRRDGGRVHRDSKLDEGMIPKPRATFGSCSNRLLKKSRVTGAVGLLDGGFMARWGGAACCPACVVV